MLGAIIGDLAVSQWKLDKNQFYRELVSDKAYLSDYGKMAIAITGYLFNGGSVDESFIKRYLSDPAYKNVPFDDKRSLINLVSGYIAYSHQDEKSAEIANQHFLDLIQCEKEDRYMTNIVFRAILRLRKGATKDEACNPDGVTWFWVLSDWNTHDGSWLADVVRAWRCFYYAFDYTSTIHNAVKCEHPEITAIIAGMFAEAMYGCKYAITKKKFNPDRFFHEIAMPPEIVKNHERELSALRNAPEPEFHQKNISQTNVELHSWKDCVIPHFSLRYETFGKIRKAGDISERDIASGIYLDDGWFYCYSRNVLLLRFKLESSEAYDECRIEKVQLSGEMSTQISLMGLVYALRDTCQIDLPENLEQYINALSFCLYFHGELESPFTPHSKESVYWQMEQEYYTDRYPDAEQRLHWEKDALMIWDDEHILPYIKCDSIPVEIKGMLSFSIQNFLYHASGGQKPKFVYAYYRIIGEHYHMPDLPKQKQ